MSMVCWRRMFPHADVWRGSTPRECFRCQGLAVKVKRTSPRHTEEKTRFHQFAHSPPHSPPIQGRELGRATWPEFLSSIAALNTLVHKTSGNSSRFPHQLLTLPAHIRNAQSYRVVAPNPWEITWNAVELNVEQLLQRQRLKATDSLSVKRRCDHLTLEERPFLSLWPARLVQTDRGTAHSFRSNYSAAPRKWTIRPNRTISVGRDCCSRMPQSVESQKIEEMDCLIFQGNFHAWARARVKKAIIYFSNARKCLTTATDPSIQIIDVLSTRILAISFTYSIVCGFLIEESSLQWKVCKLA